MHVHVRAVHDLACAQLRRATQLHRVVRDEEGALLHQHVGASVQLDELDVSHLLSAERCVAVVRRRDCLDEEGFAAEDRAQQRAAKARPVVLLLPVLRQACDGRGADDGVGEEPCGE